MVVWFVFCEESILFLIELNFFLIIFVVGKIILVLELEDMLEFFVLELRLYGLLVVRDFVGFMIYFGKSSLLDLCLFFILIFILGVIILINSWYIF